MTTDILSRIVEQKRLEVSRARERLPETELRRLAAAPRKRRPFYDVLASAGPSGVNIIAEIKRASPSKGVIRSRLDPSLYARQYEDGGADALSVLTDASFFHGSPADLAQARSAVRLPVLRKDFIIDAYQIFESAVMGADAILLIVRILSPEQLREYMALAKDSGMDVLVEIHSTSELETAVEADARLIGINNRNLETFDTDVGRASAMGGMLGPPRVAVAESGIRNRKDIERLTAAGIFNFLIGESIVRSADPARFIRSLKGY
ncbi:indole-3-glycerol phosphate synthase TrpC [Desulfococcus multivorans]|uniref:Indole-3-glycerol phosphate synthase n=1 Tax=Desulfococcus multivorans DSM 2059 TaxID=1121405 RepID=S7TBW2_DESML|nr:indole-3-glycerol phosphate synthase TrpC [Desulfococcus multivorans]AOY58887.1 TrpC: indole-3-glycerol phosphate synthase [Desulfococcus multivorans]AQV01166.1 indole-3-glycerol phosphate synthase [Desulfococcus multivorans]EPR34030.1 Indole-3-glycerol phosphate synthase [Desulfococcus multivorans DSM 2059]SJZ52563.1 indole-3-glycerol phosphate synthase [Desulfococcus multivorans DSM 2059]